MPDEVFEVRSVERKLRLSRKDVQEWRTRKPMMGCLSRDRGRKSPKTESMIDAPEWIVAL
jgi:hypothetical protein